MNRSAYGGLLIVVFGLLTLVPPPAARADEKAPVDDPERGYIVDVDSNIYDTQEAYDLVMQARKCYTESGRFDRDKAIELYEKAIAAQPGAKLNGPLANRIAGLYASNHDPERGIKTDPVKARLWFTRALEYTGPDQMLWAELHMGLGNMDKILDVDIEAVKLPDWKLWPEGSARVKIKGGDPKRAVLTPEQEARAREREQAAYEKEMERLRKSVERIQLGAAQRKLDHRKSNRADKDATLEFLQGIADKFKDAPAGQWAREQIAELK